MTPVECFNRWAGDHEWSDWAKPTLFAQGAMRNIVGTAHATDLLNAGGRIVDDHARTISAGTGERRACIVLDYPGDLAVAAGAALSRRGFAPVPLFNGVHSVQSPVIDNTSLIHALIALADHVTPGADPAPVFLLDSRRLEGSPSPGRYDNRWVVFPQDFPSGGRLIASGIRECHIITAANRIQDDLAHVLKRWQEAGIEMFDGVPGSRRPVIVAPPPWYRSVFYRMAAVTGLRPNAYGAFGALIPIAAATGYSYG
ncbi:MAG: hypothetical protein IT535_15605 [Bauldia sp.]|nr:hypothetical protein [Bauldia sp.]